MKHEIIEKDLDSIYSYERNSRTHSPGQVDQLVESIREFGFTNPILISESGEIIAGHGRYEAAVALNMPCVPCIVLAHLSASQRRAYVIADNKIALNAGWDEDILTQELIVLEEEGFDLNILGFTDDEIDELIPTGILEEEDEVDSERETEEVERCETCGQKIMQSEN